MPYRLNKGCRRIITKLDITTPIIVAIPRQEYIIRFTLCGFFAPIFWLVNVIAPWYTAFIAV